jgi:tetratricopeptide (TPR) repeat protein
LPEITTGNISEQVDDLFQVDEIDFEPESTDVNKACEAEIDFPWEEEIELTLPGDESGDVSDDGKLDVDVVVTATGESVAEESAPLEFADLYIENDDQFSRKVEPDSEKQFFESLNLDITNSLSDLMLEEEQVVGETLSDAAGNSVQPDLMGVASDHGEDTEPDKYGFDGMFSEFKKGLDQQVEQGDTETHYNLGIAYKEMGLYDDAIKEFLIAAADPLRQADCLTLQGICYQEKGDLIKAEEVFLSGIALFVREPENLLNIKYELALLYETARRKEDALHYFRDVFASSPNYRNTAEDHDLHGSRTLTSRDIEDIDLEARRG